MLLLLLESKATFPHYFAAASSESLAEHPHEFIAGRSDSMLEVHLKHLSPVSREDLGFLLKTKFTHLQWIRISTDSIFHGLY